MITTFPLTPFAAVAITSAVPFAFAVTVPSSLTESTFLSDTDHVTSLFVALSGNTCAVTFVVSPTFSSVSAAVTSILSTSTSGSTGVSFSVTVITTFPLTPFLAVAITSAVPFAFAVTFPVLSTEITSLSDTDHVTSLFVALSGVTIAVACAVSPTFNSFLSAVTATLSTGTLGSSPPSNAVTNFASAQSAWSLLSLAPINACK